MPAPTGGLNARDGLANMPITDATTLINWIPDVGGVRCRKGTREWATNIPGGAVVKSIFNYFAPATTFPSGTYLTEPTTMPGKLFCATDTAVYDITARTDAPLVAVALGGAVDDGLFSTVIVSNSGGNFLVACSEARGYYTFDGTTWLRRVAGAAAGEVSGVNPNNLAHVNLWKRRLWFVERNTTKVWYLPTDAVTGVAVALDLGPVFKKGGHLSFTASWTIDAGEGIDDFFVAVSSNGEVAIYKGTDPSGAATFALQGVWYVGQTPVGRRNYCAYGGDLLIISTDGIVPLSQVTRGGSGLLTATNKEYSTKISILIGEALRNTFTTAGWQLIMSPADRLLICNVPNYPRHASEQFALSTVVNEWTLFQGIPARCFGATGGYLFAGTADGRVLIVFQNFVDNVTFAGLGGDSIKGKVVTASSDFQTPALVKHFTMLRPVFTSGFAPGVVADVTADYSDPPLQPNVPDSGFFISAWNAAQWNSGVWGSGVNFSHANWMTVNAIGTSGAAVLSTACTGDTILARTDYMFMVGGAL